MRGSIFVLALLATGPVQAEATEASAAAGARAGDHGVAAPVCRALPRTGTRDDVAIVAPDGALWFGDRRGNRLVRVAGDGAQRSVVPVNGTTTAISGLAFGPDGSLWFTKDSSNRIGHVGVASTDGGGQEFATPGSGSFPAGLLADRKGRLWMIARTRNYVGLVRANGSVQVHRGPVALSTGFSPRAMALGADGNLWITDRGHNAIYRFDVESRRFARFDIPTPRAEPGAITRGADGNMWFTMNAVAKVGRIAPSGEIGEMDLRDLRGAELRGIAATADGSIWITSRAPRVARVLADGSVQTFSCANGLGTAFVGPDGAPWFFDDERIWIVENARRSPGTR